MSHKITAINYASVNWCSLITLTVLKIWWHSMMATTLSFNRWCKLVNCKTNRH